MPQRVFCFAKDRDIRAVNDGRHAPVCRNDSSCVADLTVQHLLTSWMTKKLSYRCQTAQHLCMPCCAVKSCPLVNDCDLLTWFFDFYLPLSHLTPSVKGSPRAMGFIFGIGKLEWATIRWRSHDDRLSRLDTIHQRGRHTDSHVAIANAAPTHCIGRQNEDRVWPVAN